MKQFLLLIFFASFIHIAVSQKAFEGVITYAVHNIDNAELLRNGELNISFAKNAIKMRYRDSSEGFEKEEILILFDSGKIYSINRQDSTFKIEAKLYPFSQTEKSKPQTILGYTTAPIEYSGNSPAGEITDEMRGTTIILQVADSLYYPIPEKYWKDEHLLMVNNNRIVLSAQYMHFRRHGHQVSENNDDTDSALIKPMYSINAIAKTITPQTFADSDMQIPHGFKKYVYTYTADSIMIADSSRIVDRGRMMVDKMTSRSKRSTARRTTKSKTKKKTAIIKSGAKKPD